jgi:hypothetical protein
MIRTRASVRAIFLSSVICLLLTGCGGHHADTGAPPPDTAPPPPGTEAVKPIEGASTASATTSDTKPGAEKPAEEIKPIPTPMETFRALAPPEGVKVPQLFAEPVKDPEQRMARIEKAVQDMRNDFDTVMPAMVRMVAMENNLRDLVEQLKTIHGNQQPENTDAAAAATAPATTPADVPAPGAVPADQAAAPAGDKQTPPAHSKATEAPAPADAKDKAPAMPETAATEASPATAPASSTASAAPEAPPAYTAPTLGKVSGVRVGDHPDMTRIVIDMSAKTAYTAELNKEGMKLIISTPQMAWEAAASATLPKGKLIAGYKYENGVMVVDLKQPAVIKARNVLGPTKGEPGYRLMIDVALRPAGG